MSSAEYLPQPAEIPASGAPAPAAPRARPEAGEKAHLVNRRTVLGAALAGGFGVATLRILGGSSSAMEEVLRRSGSLPALSQALKDAAELPMVGGVLSGAGAEIAGAVEAAVGSGAGAATGNRLDWVSPLSASRTAQVAHLLRRVAFGVTPDELERSLSEGFDRTVDRLINTPAAEPPPLPSAQDATRGNRLNAQELQTWWLQHMITTRSPLAERMTLFWHGHFTSDYRKVGLQTPFIYWQNLTWRRHALGNLREFLYQVSIDPAMLRYLDLATSTGASPNENYARELMELFTLGEGSFTEADVRAAARALAGWVTPRPTANLDIVVDAKNNIKQKQEIYEAQATGTFDPRRAYKGELSFLGRTGQFDLRTVIDTILAKPAAAMFIAGKMATHFISARPDPGTVRSIADQFRASGYDLKTLVRATLMSPEFRADSSYRALVKSPVEMMVDAGRTLGVDPAAAAKLMVQAAQGMGQSLFDPPDVGGWPNNEAWISSSTVIARINFASSLVGLLKAGVPSFGGAVDRVLDGVLSPGTAQALSQAAGDRARWSLLLASPEFHLK